MPLFELNDHGLTTIAETSFQAMDVRERQGLQACLRDHIEALSPDLLVVSEEFGHWEDSRRRIDLLAIDKQANLVVVELKRSEDGGHMDLQAIRYAAMVSTMTFAQVVEAFTGYIDRRDLPIDAPEDHLLDFLGWDEVDEMQFAQNVRILLCSAEFSRELTTAVLWLNKNGLDITCMRLKPYRLDNRLVLNVEQIIPLPEADSYQIRIREKEQRIKEQRSQDRDFTKFTITYGGQEFNHLTKRKFIWHACNAVILAGVPLADLAHSFERANRCILVDGVVTGDEAIEAWGRDHQREMDRRRWFVAVDEVWHDQAATLVLTNQWGTQTVSTVERMRQHWPQAGIRFVAEAD